MTHAFFALLGRHMCDKMLNLLALRYGTSSGVITLESFISLVLRLECMTREYIQFGLFAPTIQQKKDWWQIILLSFSIDVFKQLSDGKAMTLQEPEVSYHMSGTISCT